MRHCCFIADDSTPCADPAEWEAVLTPRPDGTTDGCSAHVGLLVDDGIDDVTMHRIVEPA